MKLLSQKQKRELLYTLLLGFCIELPKHTKTILVAIFIIIGTMLGINCCVSFNGFTVAFGNDVISCDRQFIKD